MIRPFFHRWSTTILAFLLAAPVLSFGADTSNNSPTSSMPGAPASAPAANPPMTQTPASSSTDTTSTTTPPATTDTARPTTYTMESGDTLDSVAKKFDTSIHALAKLNHISKSQYKKLRAGKVLQLPAPKTDSAK